MMTVRPIFRSSMSIALSAWIGLGSLPAMVSLPGASIAAADEVRGFIQPYRRIAVAAGEMGVVSEVHVNRGQRVKAGEPMIELDDRVLRSTLALSAAAMNSSGLVDAAEADVRVKQRSHDALVQLQSQGNASPNEVQRAAGELAEAVARLKSANEQQLLRELEHARTAEQIEQRTVRAPIDGVVVTIQKDLGEFIAPTDPVVVEIVQLDRLKCDLNLPRSVTLSLRAGDPLMLTIGSQSTSVPGRIEFVSPVVDPQSGTVLVTVVIDNADGQLQAGLICRVDTDEVAVHRTAQRP